MLKSVLAALEFSLGFLGCSSGFVFLAPVSFAAEDSLVPWLKLSVVEAVPSDFHSSFLLIAYWVHR